MLEATGEPRKVQGIKPDGVRAGIIRGGWGANGRGYGCTRRRWQVLPSRRCEAGVLPENGANASSYLLGRSSHPRMHIPSKAGSLRSE